MKKPATMYIIEHYIIHYTVHPEVSKGKFVCSTRLRYLSPNGTIVENYVILNSFVGDAA